MPVPDPAAQSFRGAGGGDRPQSDGSQLVVAHEERTHLVDGFDGGALEPALRDLCTLTHPWVSVRDGMVTVECESEEGTRSREILLDFALALDDHARGAARGVYR